MDNIKDQLEIITTNSIRRRLEREFINLISLDLIYPETVFINFNKDNQIHNHNLISVSFITTKEYRHFEFIITLHYPFHPPKLNINFKPYIYYLNFNSLEFRENLFKHKNVRCFCCNTKTCSDNWSPGFTLKHILEEVEEFKQNCRDISYILIIDVIKRKYLNSDINIVEWLL
jgi:ubiquitin-protein ligase